MDWRFAPRAHCWFRIDDGVPYRAARLACLCGMRVLYSQRVMLYCLLLNTGCMLRVSSEILAYENYWPAAWHALPWSAVCELMAVGLFAANILLTLKQPPTHLRAAT